MDSGGRSAHSRRKRLILGQHSSVNFILELRTTPKEGLLKSSVGHSESGAAVLLSPVSKATCCEHIILDAAELASE